SVLYPLSLHDALPISLPATCGRFLALALPAASSGNLEQHPGRIAQVEPTLFTRLLDLGHALILVIGMNGAQHVLGTQLAASDGRQYVLDILARQPVQHGLDRILAETFAG